MFLLWALLKLSVLSLGADARPLELTPLKPLKVSARNLGRISATLISSKEEQIVDSISALVGDCAKCARGIAVKGVLGIRFEGNSRDLLRVVKKSVPGVRYRDCKQLNLPKAGTYECTFSFRDATYTVKLVSEPLRRLKK